MIPSEEDSDRNSVVEKGIELVNRGEISKARDIFLSVLGVDPKNIQANIYLGICEINLGRTEPGLKFIDKAIKLDPQNIAALYYKAETLLRLKKYSGAKAIFQTILDISPNEENAKKGLQECNLALAEEEEEVEKPEPGEDESGAVRVAAVEGEPGDKGEEAATGGLGGGTDERLKTLVRRKCGIVEGKIERLESSGRSMEEHKTALEDVKQSMELDDWEGALDQVNEIDQDIEDIKIETKKLDLGEPALKLDLIKKFDKAERSDFLDKYISPAPDDLIDLDLKLGVMIGDDNLEEAAKLLAKNEEEIDEVYVRLAAAIENAVLDVKNTLISLNEDITMLSEFDQERYKALYSDVEDIEKLFHQGHLIEANKELMEFDTSIPKWKELVVRENIRRKLKSIHEKFDSSIEGMDSGIVQSYFQTVLSSIFRAKKYYNEERYEEAREGVAAAKEELDEAINQYLEGNLMPELNELTSKLAIYKTKKQSSETISKADELRESISEALEKRDLVGLRTKYARFKELMEKIAGEMELVGIDEKLIQIESMIDIAGILNMPTADLNSRLKELKKEEEQGFIDTQHVDDMYNYVKKKLMEGWSSHLPSIQNSLDEIAHTVNESTMSHLKNYVKGAEDKLKKEEFEKFRQILKKVQTQIEGFSKKIGLKEIRKKGMELRSEIEASRDIAISMGWDTPELDELNNRIDEVLSLSDPETATAMLKSVEGDFAKVKNELDEKLSEHKEAKSEIAKIQQKGQEYGERAEQLQEDLFSIGNVPKKLTDVRRGIEVLMSAREVDIAEAVLEDVKADLDAAEDEARDIKADFIRNAAMQELKPILSSLKKRGAELGDIKARGREMTKELKAGKIDSAFERFKTLKKNLELLDKAYDSLGKETMNKLERYKKDLKTYPPAIRANVRMKLQTIDENIEDGNLATVDALRVSIDTLLESVGRGERKEAEAEAAARPPAEEDIGQRLEAIISKIDTVVAENPEIEINDMLDIDEVQQNIERALEAGDREGAFSYLDEIDRVLDLATGVGEEEVAEEGEVGELSAEEMDEELETIRATLDELYTMKRPDELIGVEAQYADAERLLMEGDLEGARKELSSALTSLHDLLYNYSGEPNK